MVEMESIGLSECVPETALTCCQNVLISESLKKIFINSVVESIGVKVLSKSHTMDIL